ncbi:hypothetical protein PUN28_012809 [Cardiocondyla obscurior]|uniref:Uncharacterized protein n=1 Tax=Cardiocondyla obscurior TaxID=286306 RepID=A0AAW2F7T9_9HYME
MIHRVNQTDVPYRRTSSAILKPKASKAHACVTYDGTLFKFNRCFILRAGMHPRIWHFPRFNADSDTQNAKSTICYG